MKKMIYHFLIVAFFALFAIPGNTVHAQAPDSLSSDFSLPNKGCVQQHINIIYTGNAPANAVYLWNFGGAVIISGSGQGPYWVRWETVGVKTVSLSVTWETHTSTTTKQIHIMPAPLIFHMTGGGSYPAGGQGVEVGLSGSELGMIYKLRRGAVYTEIVKTGTGNPISFGLQTEPGSYNAVAYGEGCLVEMEGTAVVTILYPPHQNICMVTFDTAAQKNKVIWNKIEGEHLSHFNIYKETFQNEHYEKIAEVPYTNLSVYVDENSQPLVKSDKYRISVTDSANHESDKSPYHKTIHLNINAGIYGFNLIWNHYEGFEYLSYHIYRKLGEGPYELIAGVASNVDSYTDFYLQPGLVTYYIEVVRPEPCTPSLKSQEYNSVVSNIATAAPLGIEDNRNTGIIVYPVPAHDKVFVVMSPDAGRSARIELFRPNGQLIQTLQPEEARSELDLTTLSAGVYFIRISSENSTVVKKIIKE
jgi:hypothetical protein